MMSGKYSSVLSKSRRSEDVAVKRGLDRSLKLLERKPIALRGS